MDEQTSSLFTSYIKYACAVAKKLFTSTEMKTLIHLIKKGYKLAKDFWRATQGESRREYRDISPVAYFSANLRDDWLLRKVQNGSHGIIHDNLYYSYASLIRCLNGCGEQDKHIDARTKESKGVSVIVAIMKETYIVDYMNGEKKYIELDVGDVLYFSNAFEHGGGKYVITDEIENILELDKELAHYRLFLSYQHYEDGDNKHFNRDI